MATNFPTGIDNYTTLIDNVDAIMAVHVNDPRSAISAIEAKVGADNSVVASSLDYKLRNHTHAGGAQGVAVNLTTSVTGILPESNGGTGVSDLKISASGYAVYKA